MSLPFFPPSFVTLFYYGGINRTPKKPRDYIVLLSHSLGTYFS